jgi:hypothetical protein
LAALLEEGRVEARVEDSQLVGFHRRKREKKRESGNEEPSGDGTGGFSL